MTWERDNALLLAGEGGQDHPRAALGTRGRVTLGLDASTPERNGESLCLAKKWANYPE